MSALVELNRVCVERSGTRILDDVSFKGNGGDFIGVIGPNGAGKSTFLRALAGLEPLCTGECRLGDREAVSLAPVARARLLSFLPQARPIFWAMRADAIVALGRFAYGAPARLEGENAKAVARAMDAAGIAHLSARAATTLSGGEAARVHLARALAAETPILLADEPTAALDPRHQIAIMKVLRARADAGGLVIAALHDLALAARFCTRIILLERGRMTADGAPQTTLTTANLARAFEATAHVKEDGGRLTVSFG